MIRRCRVGLSALILAGLATGSAGAQRLSHGAGVSWSGTHGGVSWDGGHGYEGGGYGGYPATSSPRPAYQTPQPSSHLTHAPRPPYYQKNSSPRSAQHHDDRLSDQAAQNSEH